MVIAAAWRRRKNTTDVLGANASRIAWHAWADFDESANVVARYLFGDSIDEIVARWQPTDETVWYLTDHLGTVRDIVDDTGSLINTITYDSFGNILGQTNATAGDRFTFTGREYDPELDLYYYRARYYDPGLGRFVSQDPIGFAGGDANLYRYVGNIPNNALDPTGTSFATGLSSGIRDLMFGIKRVAVSNAYGAAGLFNVRASVKAVQIHSQNEGMLELGQWLTSEPTAIQEFATKLVTHAFDRLPPDVRNDIIIELGRRAGMTGTGRMTGNIITNLVTQKFANMIAHRLSQQLAASAVGRMRRFGSGASLGVAILGLQAFGVTEQTVQASERLRQRDPQLWQWLYRNHRMDLLYGFVEDHLNMLLTEIDLAIDEFAPKGKCPE